MSKIKILIADDHSLMRVGLNALFSHQHDMEVVGEACDGIEAVNLAEQLNPDIVVMDLKMPKLDGAEATRRILDVTPDAKVVILTSYGSSDDLVRAVANGAKIAVDEINAEGTGFTIELQAQDDEHDAERLYYGEGRVTHNL